MAARLEATEEMMACSGYFSHASPRNFKHIPILDLSNWGHWLGASYTGQQLGADTPASNKEARKDFKTDCEFQPLQVVTKGP